MIAAPDANALRELIDRNSIRDVLARYFQGLDRGDPEQVRSCFTADVVAHYDGRSALRPGDGSAVHGIDTLMASLFTFKNQQSGKWKITTHFMGNLNFENVGEESAETETNAMAFIVLASESGDQVAMRSLRYLDRLRRTQDGWRISERRHTLDWSCQVPADFAITLAQRVTQAPWHAQTTAL